MVGPQAVEIDGQEGRLSTEVALEQNGLVPQSRVASDDIRSGEADGDSRARRDDRGNVLMAKVSQVQTRAPFVNPETGVLTIHGRQFLEDFLRRTGGSGDHTVLSRVGSSPSTDAAVVRFDGTSGSNFKTTTVTIDDSNNMTVPGTVNARDVGADGTKLDTVQSGAQINDIVIFEATIGQADLASGGTKIVLDATAGQQWKVREVYLSGAGTNFNGGGDRNMDIKEGSTGYTTVPAATLQALAAARWGDTAAPFPASPSDFTTATSAGADIVAAYSGGTTDYTAGSATVILFAELVAP